MLFLKGLSKKPNFLLVTVSFLLLELLNAIISRMMKNIESASSMIEATVNETF
jgi:hypothetical protein